jgi:anti-repressor protein
MSQIYPDFAYNNPIQRGEIFLSTYVGEGYLEKLRPVVVIQNNLGNKHSRSIIVAAVTSKPKKELPVNVVIDPTKYSLEVENCTIMANQVFTIDKDYLRFKKGCLDAEDLGRLDEALKASFDLKSQEGKEMNELTVVNRNGRFVVDSREVAEMTEVRHSDLLEKINGYVQTLNSSENGKFRSLDFFIPHTYTVEGNTKTYPCYLLTRKGCDMIANKMTGEKGVLFTAAYVTKFEEMEKALQPVPKSPAELIAAGYKAALDLIEEMKPKAESFDRFISADNLQPIGVVAKSLNISSSGRKMGRNNLFAVLREKGILMADNTPMQQYINQGYFEVKQRPIQMGDQVIDKPQTYCTPKGITWLSKMLNQ